jgi:hypothetical protein
MSEKKEGWYIFAHKEGNKEFALAHFIQGEPPEHAAVCGQPTPFDLSGVKPWNPHNPQHIHEIRQHYWCQEAIAIRDGRKPMKELYAPVPRPEARTERKRPAKKAAR